jgi:histidinol-phosphate aminotransferase
MLSFIRSDLAQLVAYTPHPGGAAGHGTPDQTQHHLTDRLDTNESPFDLPDDLKQKLGWAFQHEIESNRYPDGGHAPLKAAIAEYVNESTPAAITAHQISVSSGSDELIRSVIIATCLRGEGSILVAQPTFSMYGILAETLGVPVVRVGRSDTFEMALSAAQTAIEQTQDPPVRVVFVVNPNSPTGNALTTAELDWLRSLPDHILVVMDEAYFEFSQQSVVSELAQRPNWIVLRTFSKAFRLAAHRLGYAIAHPELIAILEKVRLPYNLPSMTQAAALVALSHRSTLLTCIPQILEQREMLYRALAEHPALQVFPSAGNFLFVKVNPHSPMANRVTVDYLFEQLRDRGTLVRMISGGLRITIGTVDENQRTLERLVGLLTP